MLDGIWHVYRPDGSYLGLFLTRTGNDVLQLNEKIAKTITIGDVLHMDETHSKKAWEVRVTGNYLGNASEFTIQKLSDRAERYPERKFSVRVTSHR